MTPTEAVRDYLESYVTLDDSVVNQLNDYVDDNEELTDNHKDVYQYFVDFTHDGYYDIFAIDYDAQYNEDTHVSTYSNQIGYLYSHQSDGSYQKQEITGEFDDDVERTIILDFIPHYKYSNEFDGDVELELRDTGVKYGWRGVSQNGYKEDYTMTTLEMVPSLIT